MGSKTCAKKEKRKCQSRITIVKFLITIGSNDYDVIITYDDLCDDAVEAQIARRSVSTIYQKEEHDGRKHVHYGYELLDMSAH